MPVPAVDPFAVSPDQIAAANNAFAGQAPAGPDPGAIPPALLAGPGAGTILPPAGPGDAADVFANGILAQRPNPIVAVPPPPGQAPILGPNQQPLGGPAPLPAAVPPVAVPKGARGGGGTGGGPDELSKLDTQIQQAGNKEAQGIEKTQEAKAEGADALAKATQDLAVEQRADAQELADKQTQNRALQAELDQQDKANLQKAKDYTIPEFWKGAEGARVGSIISAAMGSISSAILGGPNGALQTINKYTDDYFHRQKEKVDNLYKYAEQTGRLNDKTRLRYAQELVDLKDQHAAVQQSILTRIKSVADQNQGTVDRALTDQMVGQLEQQVAKTRMQTPVERAHIAQMRAATAASYANAAESRAKAAAAKTGNDEKADEAAYKTYVQPRVRQSEELNRRINALNSAKAGALNPNASYGEVISALEQGIAADAGAGVRAVSTGQLHSIIPNMMSAEGKWSNFINQNLNATAGPEFRKGALRFISRAQEVRSQEARENADNVEKEMASTPYGKRSPDFAKRARERLYPTASGPAAPQQGGGMVTIRNAKTGETKQVTRAEAQQLGAI